MSGRIQKLIEECTFIYDDMVYDGTDSYMKTTEYFDKEKFADLIIKECIKIALDHDPLWGASVDQDIERLLGVK